MTFVTLNKNIAKVAINTKTEGEKPPSANLWIFVREEK